MRINFIGCPCSGKTTTAAMVFAKLKELGMNCEFITEQARLHIANLRWQRNLKPEDPCPLTDSDQFEIMIKQIETEEIVSTAVGNSVVVICDSSAFNSLLYMSKEDKDQALKWDLVHRAKDQSDLVFYCPPVDESKGLDPNRVHSREQSLLIDSQI